MAAIPLVSEIGLLFMMASALAASRSHSHRILFPIFNHEDMGRFDFAERVEDIFLRFINRPDELKGGPIWNEEYLSRRLNQLKQEGEMLEKMAKIEALEDTLYKLNRRQREVQEKMRYYDPEAEKIASLFEAGVYQQFLDNAIQRIEHSKVKLLGNRIVQKTNEDMEVASLDVADEDSDADESANLNKNRNPSSDEHHQEEACATGPHLNLHFLKAQKNWNLSSDGQAPTLNIK